MFKYGFCLSAGYAASQSEAMLENHKKSIFGVGFCPHMTVYMNVFIYITDVDTIHN